MSWDNYDTAGVEEFVGKTFVKIENKDDGELLFWTEGKSGSYRMCHHQACCENVYLSEVIGDLDDIVGVPVLRAEEVVSNGGGDDDGYGSSTWTFYKISTIKGTVTLRWYGESNGYYSETVDIDRWRDEIPH